MLRWFQVELLAWVRSDVLAHSIAMWVLRSASVRVGLRVRGKGEAGGGGGEEEE